ncbi:hypothetical protein [Methylobacter sp.]|uniref:hypothetical protein n=1 Tax=Methylobacter sp. TaxID=2051955 RepID=UPI002FDDB823
MALCIDASPAGVLSVSSTQTEVDCTTYLLMSADQYRLSSGFFVGVDLTDVIEVSWLVALVWAIAWGLKHSSKAL